MIIKPESHMRLWFYIFSRESYIPFNENHTIIKGENMFAGISAIAIAIAALAGEYYVVALTQEH